MLNVDVDGISDFKSSVMAEWSDSGALISIMVQDCTSVERLFEIRKESSRTWIFSPCNLHVNRSVSGLRRRQMSNKSNRLIRRSISWITQAFFKMELRCLDWRCKVFLNQVTINSLLPFCGTTLVERAIFFLTNAFLPLFFTLFFTFYFYFILFLFLFYFILFYFILFYFILFYFLFYFYFIFILFLFFYFLLYFFYSKIENGWFPDEANY